MDVVWGLHDEQQLCRSVRVTAALVVGENPSSTSFPHPLSCLRQRHEGPPAHGRGCGRIHGRDVCRTWLPIARDRKLNIEDSLKYINRQPVYLGLYLPGGQGRDYGLHRAVVPHISRWGKRNSGSSILSRRHCGREWSTVPSKAATSLESRSVEQAEHRQESLASAFRNCP